jgi:hypothetical protein
MTRKKKRLLNSMKTCRATMKSGCLIRTKPWLLGYSRGLGLRPHKTQEMRVDRDPLKRTQTKSFKKTTTITQRCRFQTNSNCRDNRSSLLNSWWRCFRWTICMGSMGTCSSVGLRSSKKKITLSSTELNSSAPSYLTSRLAYTRLIWTKNHHLKKSRLLLKTNFDLRVQITRSLQLWGRIKTSRALCRSGQGGQEIQIPTRR